MSKPMAFHNRQDPDVSGDITHLLGAKDNGLAVAFSIQERAISENERAGPDGIGVQQNIAYTLEARPTTQSVAFVQNQRDEVRTMEVAGALPAEPDVKQQTYVMHAGVRRLTPRECERLMGFHDDYTLVPYRSKPAADGPRYKALGNSMAVPCMRWLGQRIELVQKLLEAACPPTYSAGPPDKLLEETV